MSDPFTILGTVAVGFAVSKLTESITGSDTLGMIAGLAAGGWAGSAISGYMAASAVPAAAGAATAPGSALGVAGSAPLGAAAKTAVPTGSPIAAQAAQLASGGPAAAAALPGAAPLATAPAAAVAPAAASSGGGFLSGFDPNEVLKVAASGLSGMAEAHQRKKDREVEKDYLELREREFEEDKRRYYAQGAYGVTNDGRIVPINAGQQLQAMNQRLGYQPHTTSGTMVNINAVPRAEGGYLAQFGRFGGNNA